MSYEIITGQLVTRTALHIGAGQDNGTTDALLRRDARGRLLIPGTTLAGALRALATRLAPRLGHEPWEPCWALRPPSQRVANQACKCPACHLFGDVNPLEQADAGEASRLWVADAFLETAGQETQIRDGVGIDRQDRVAARQGAVKFDLEVLLPGAVFSIRMELQNTTEADEQLLATALAEWEQDRGALGGRVNRGLGAFRLIQFQRAQRDLSNAEALLTFLKEDKPWQGSQTIDGWLARQLSTARQARQPLDNTLQALPIARSWLEVRFLLEADGPFLINDPLAQAQSGFDHAPLALGMLKPEQAAKPFPVLPGASLRGALRSQAERIARTLATLDAWQQPDHQRQTYFATRCPACDPNARRKREESGAPVALESCNSLLRVANVGSETEVEEHQLCPACWVFGSARQGSRLRVEDAVFMGQKPAYKPRDFLAIDRFTGGGAEHYKFDAVELWKPRFAARLRLENPAAWELGWLLLTLRDLEDGIIPLGFGAAKGMGAVHIVEWTGRLGFVHATDLPEALPADISPTPSGFYDIVEATWTPGHPPLTWQATAQSWIQTFNHHLRNFQRQGKLSAMLVDTYFGREHLTQGYPAEVARHGAD